MITDSKGRILCHNIKTGNDRHMAKAFVANKHLMAKYGWQVVEDSKPQAPAVSLATKEKKEPVAQTEVMPTATGTTLEKLNGLKESALAKNKEAEVK